MNRRFRILLVCSGLAIGWACQEALAATCSPTNNATCAGTGRDFGGCFTTSPTACVAPSHAVKTCVAGYGTCGWFGASNCTGACVKSGYECSVSGVADQCSN
jgi:hypothetical protein